MIGRARQAVTTVLSLGALYGIAGVLGFALLVLTFQFGLLRNIDIMFYRGLVLIGLVGVTLFGLLAFALRRWRPFGLGPRDAFAAAVLSFSLNLAFLVVVPVTVDRSISIFMLDRMAAQPDTTFTADSMTALFAKVYLGEDRQIARRLREQVVSGNVEQTDGGYRIASHGRAVVAVARVVATLFDSHAGILTPAVPAKVSARDLR